MQSFIEYVFNEKREITESAKNKQTEVIQNNLTKREINREEKLANLFNTLRADNIKIESVKPVKNNIIISFYDEIPLKYFRNLGVEYKRDETNKKVILKLD